MKSPTKQHRQLGSTRVHFMRPSEDGSEAEVGVMDINAVIVTKTRNITAADLHRIQEASQMAFRKRIPDPVVEVVDVYIEGITYLGLDSKEDFHNIQGLANTPVSRDNQQTSSLLDGVGS